MSRLISNLPNNLDLVLNVRKYKLGAIYFSIQKRSDSLHKNKSQHDLEYRVTTTSVRLTNLICLSFCLILGTPMLPDFC